MSTPENRKAGQEEGERRKEAATIDSKPCAALHSQSPSSAADLRARCRLRDGR